MKLAHNSYQFILKLWNCTCCLILCDEPNPKEWQLIVSGRVFAFENVKVLVIELLLTWKITMHMSEYVRSMSEDVRSMSEVFQCTQHHSTISTLGITTGEAWLPHSAVFQLQRNRDTVRLWSSKEDLFLWNLASAMHLLYSSIFIFHNTGRDV